MIDWTKAIALLVWVVLDIAVIMQLWSRNALTTGVRVVWTLVVVLFPFVGALAALAAPLVARRTRATPPSA